MKANTRKKTAWAFVALFFLLNTVAFFHAYKFTHFSEPGTYKTQSPDKLSLAEKVQTLLFGISNPRPENRRLPSQTFETVRLQSNKAIEGWHIRSTPSMGTVALFHGYGENKTFMLGKGEELVKLGYSVFLIDFMGSGGSEGSQTTLGFKEAEEVKTVFDHLKGQGEEKIYLFGTSMGAAALMKAIDDFGLKPKGVIIEFPFGSMYQAVSARFRNMHVPTIPMAGLLVFWGGVQNGFWAFDHAPSEYAKKIDMPVLMLYGAQDRNVTIGEIEEIYRNLPGSKRLRTFESAGHENFLAGKYRDDWIASVKAFMEETDSALR